MKSIQPRILALIALCAIGLAQCGVSLQFVVTHPADTDYTPFATGGVLINTNPTALYERSAQFMAQSELLGTQVYDYSYHPYTTPPLVAWLFSPLARLPLARGVQIWLTVLVLCLVLMAAGFRAMLPESISPRERALTAFALAISPASATGLLLLQLEPLLMLTGGIGALLLIRRGRLFWAGLALSILCAKAQYIWLAIPILVIAQQRRMLYGLGTGILGWATTGLVIAGWQSVGGYLRELQASGPQLSLVRLSESLGIPQLIAYLLLASAAVLIVALAYQGRRRLAEDPFLCAALVVAASAATVPHVAAASCMALTIGILWRARVTRATPTVALVMLYVGSTLFPISETLRMVVLDGTILTGALALAIATARSDA